MADPSADQVLNDLAFTGHTHPSNVLALLADRSALLELLRDAVDAGIWLSGLPCLNPESEAWTHWETVARPKLSAALTALGERSPA